MSSLLSYCLEDVLGECGKIVEVSDCEELVGVTYRR